MSSSQEETYNLIVNQVSPDNQQRILAEQAFNHAVALEPTLIFSHLIQIASNGSIDSSLRQSSLLHLKRLVPKYWSAAFPSFVGPSCISQDVKSAIRSNLMLLICNTDSKIRNSGSYAIIQIALVDYPDEWPSLLNDLYSLINSNDFNKMMGSLTVLRDLFDDLVTDEQFFEGGVGEVVMQNCSNLLLDKSVSMEIKIETMKLFETSLVQLSSQLNLNQARKSFIKQLVDNSLDLVLNLLNEMTQEVCYNSILDQVLKFEIYRCLNSISNNFNHLFNHKIASTINSINEIVIKDLIFLNEIKLNNESSYPDFQNLLKIQVTPFELERFVSELFSELLLFLTVLSSKFSFKDKNGLLKMFVDALIKVSILPESLKEEWSSDFNSFVTLESGLTIEVHIRNAVQDYLIDLTHDSETVFKQVYNELANLFVPNVLSIDWQESVLFLMGALFQNEESMNFQGSLVNLLNNLLKLLSNSKDEFLKSRIILILPRFFGKFETQIDAQSFGLRTLEEIIKYQDTELNKTAILFSFTYFNYFLRSSLMNSNIQNSIIKIIRDLSEDSDEDANLMLLESLSVAICINNKQLAKTSETLELILKICYKDSSNLGLVDSGRECLNDLLLDLPEEDFLRQCEKALPIFANIMNESLREKVDFTPTLDLSLEFLITFVDDEKPLTQEIFNYVFPPLTQLILFSGDDQLLQVSNEVFNNILNHDSVSSYISNFANGMNILLEIVSKYLSPSLSDQAILNVGDLITKLIKNFANDPNINQYLDQILQTVTKRLVITKEFPTIENLILIFANLAITSPQQTLDFLSGFDLDGSTKLITKVIPVWLQTFETVRGHHKILLNIKALSEIFILKDPRLNSIMVNSDELIPNEALNDKIITRSMRKNLQFIQIPAPVKIIKLFINELKFQLSQPDMDTVKNAISLVGNKTVEEPQDDEWEDLNEYEEFAHFDNEDDDEDDGEDGDKDARSTGDNGEELLILKSFFRRVGNDNYFKEIFNYLKEDEKKILTDFVNS